MCSSSRHSSRNEDQGGCCSKPCCCCCDKRGAAICFSIIGLILATAVIVPPVWIHLHNKDYKVLFPMLKLAKTYLRSISDEKGEKLLVLESENKDDINGTLEIEDTELDSDDKYKLAIFQLIDDTEDQAHCLAFFSFCMGCLNVPLDIFLFFGAIFRTPCALLPWLFFTIIEILIVGIPFIVYSGLISLYLAAQFELYLEASILLGVIVGLFFLSLSSWLTVLRCYKVFGRRAPYVVPDLQQCSDSQLTQPLLPPDHHSQSYHLGQYPQYYPPHSGGGQRHHLPSAPPPQVNNGIYPSLSNA